MTLIASKVGWTIRTLHMYTEVSWDLLQRTRIWLRSSNFQIRSRFGVRAVTFNRRVATVISFQHYELGLWQPRRPHCWTIQSRDEFISVFLSSSNSTCSYLSQSWRYWYEGQTPETKEGVKRDSWLWPVSHGVIDFWKSCRWVRSVLKQSMLDVQLS